MGTKAFVLILPLTQRTSQVFDAINAIKKVQEVVKKVQEVSKKCSDA